MRRSWRSLVDHGRRFGIARLVVESGMSYIKRLKKYGMIGLAIHTSPNHQHLKFKR